MLKVASKSMIKERGGYNLIKTQITQKEREKIYKIERMQDNCGENDESYFVA